mgnify:CR=1 FL=1
MVLLQYSELKVQLYMLFSSNESIEDAAIRLISIGKTTPIDIFESLQNEGNSISKRGVYKAIHYLREHSILVKSGKKLSISQEWVDSLTRALKNNFTMPVLADGESATYKYKSLVNLDAYWKHLTKSLKDQYHSHPVFLYSPYNIWLHLADRSESQLDYYRAFEKEGRHGYLVIGNRSELDMEFKKTLQSEFLQIDTWDKPPFKETEYYTIIDDIIVTTKVGPKLTKIIASFYKSTPTLESKLKLNRILDMTDISKIKIERNNKKAKYLRNRLSKNFYIPKELEQKFNLF